MFDSESEARLRRLFNPPAKAPPEKERALEGRLLARFDELYPKKESYKMKSFVTRRALLAAAAALVLGVVAACTAPVDLDLEVGRSLSIRYDPATPGSPKPKDLAEFIRTKSSPEGKVEGVGLRIHGEGLPWPSRGAAEAVGLRIRGEESAVAIEAELWGTGLSLGPLAPKIREAFPALATAEIKEEILHGKVRSTIAKKLGHDMLDLDVVAAADVETAKKQVMEQLRARGIEGKVDIQVEGDGAERKVMIRVEKEGCDPPGGSAAPEGESAVPVEH